MARSVVCIVSRSVSAYVLAFLKLPVDDVFSSEWERKSTNVGCGDVCDNKP